MRLSFNTWTYSSFPVWVPAYPLDEVIRRLARIGYDGIEIGAAAPHAFPDYLTNDRISEIRRLLDDNGIACSSMLPAPGGGAGFNVASPDPAERAAAIDQYKKVADLCHAWGSPTLIYVAGWQIFGTDRRQAWDWSATALEQVADHAGKDLTVVVEPTSSDSNLIDSCDDLIQIIEHVDRSNVAAMFDTFHTLYRNEVPTDYVPPPRAASDAHPPGRREPRPAGERRRRLPLTDRGPEGNWLSGLLNYGDWIQPPKRRAR